MTEQDEKPRLEIDWVRTVAAALAAMTSAVMLSTLGVVGTVVGAAVGSLAATIGTALYSQGLARSRHAVVKAQGSALGKIGRAESSLQRAQDATGPHEDAYLARAEDQIQDARADLEEIAEDPSAVPPVQVGWRTRLAALPWRRIVVGAAALFVVVMTVLVAFELLAGRSVSSFTGGTDQDRRTTLFDGSGDDQDEPPGDTPGDTTTPTEGATSESSDTAPEESTVSSETVDTESTSPAPFGTAPTGTLEETAVPTTPVE